MVSGVSIKFRTYLETVPKLLSLIKLEKELEKHDKIILQPQLKNSSSRHTSPDFIDSVLKFCMENKKQDAKVFIAAGADGESTDKALDKAGYKRLSEKYSVGLIDLNTAETEEIMDGEFLKFDKIMYPKVLLDAFVISLPFLAEDEETEMVSSLSTMLSSFPSKYYSGFFSKAKNKIRNWPIKYSIHDSLKCKFPEFAIFDASEQGFILAGKPIEIDKQAAKVLGLNWKAVQHLRLADESFSGQVKMSKKEPISPTEQRDSKNN